MRDKFFFQKKFVEYYQPVMEFQNFENEGKLNSSLKLLNDKRIVQTFFEAYTELKEARRNKKINDDEFLKGLLEILEGLSIFTHYDEAFSEQEKEIQNSVLSGFLESAFIFMKKHLGINCSLEEQFEDIKRRHFIGLSGISETWKGLLRLAAELSDEFQNISIPPEKKPLIIPLIVAFIKFYYWVLLQKRETLEDLL